MRLWKLEHQVRQFQPESPLCAQGSATIALGALMCADGWPHGGLLLMAAGTSRRSTSCCRRPRHRRQALRGLRTQEAVLRNGGRGARPLVRRQCQGPWSRADSRATALNTTTLCSQRTFEHSAMARRQLAQCTAAFNCMQLGNTKIKAAIMNNRSLVLVCS